MAKNALIVGPPRSGTSLASSILAGAGYHVGSILHPRDRLGDDHNPFGYFEADEVVECNAAILHRSGYRFHNTWTFAPIEPASAKRVADLPPKERDRHLVARYESRSPWLWKDPRLCFTLPYWWKLVDPDRTVVYLTTRDPRDAYPSFLRKGWCRSGIAERRRVTDLVRQHARAAKETVQSLGIPHVTVDYAEYTADPHAVAERLSRAFGVGLSVSDLNFHPELDHSGLRGRFSAHVRRHLKRLPREQVERVARLVPDRVVGFLFPERLHSHCVRKAGDRERSASLPPA
jgi:hypothetical protein